MLGCRVINPKKLEKARGDRTREQIAQQSGGAFKEQDLYNWEKGKNRPRPERVPYLLKVLGVSFEEVSDELGAEIIA